MRPVRAAGPRDLSPLVRLWIAITTHHADFDPLFRLRPDVEPLVRDLLRRTLGDPDAAIFLHEEGNEVLGMCSVRIDRAPPILQETERAEITDLGVREDARRRGVGRSLAQAAFTWAAERSVKRVEVRVASRNAEGQAFWRALDFDALMDVLQRRL